MPRQSTSLALLMLAFSAMAEAQAIRSNPGFNTRSVPRNDDGSSSLQQLGFTINFFGKQRSQVYVNNNGNVTFDNALSTYTPFGLESTRREIIAAFFSDVDTRPPGSKLVTYGEDMIGGRKAFGVNYIDVGYFNVHDDKLNSFQIVLVDRSDLGPGNFDIEFNYARIVWETGDASDGVGGYGGVSASVGWSNGTGAPGTSFELDGSLVPGSFLDGARLSLARNRLNSSIPGRFVFRARDGQILPPLTMQTGCPLPPANLNTPYLTRLSAIGGLQYRWSMLADPGASLPAGLTLQENGTLSGSPTAAGTSEFTLRLVSVTEDGEEVVSKRCSISVLPPQLSITTSCPLPQATVGQPYSRSLAVSGIGGPVVWRLADHSTALPVGLSLSPNGAISGVPVEPGSVVFTVIAASGQNDGSEPVTRSCGLTVKPAVLNLSSSCSLPAATAGVPYSQELTVSGGAAPYNWTTRGLPAGISLSPSGQLSGVPANQGTAMFDAEVTDANGLTLRQSCTLRVDNSPLNVTTACPLPLAQSGQPYSQRFTVAGGTAPYSWSVLGTLPVGLTLRGDGVLSGAPFGSGSAGFRLLVSDAEGRSASKSCTIQMLPADLQLSSCPLPNAVAGAPYSTRLSSQGGEAPYFYSGTLPAGLSMTSAGLVTGTPRAAGVYPLSIRATDHLGKTILQPCRISIAPSPLQISGDCPLPEALIGTPYLQRFSVSGGSAPYTFRVDGRLPAGLSFTPDGTLRGVPLVAERSTFEIEASDSGGRSNVKSCSVQSGLPDLPTISITGVPATVAPSVAGPLVSVQLSKAAPLPISGELVVTLEGDTGTGDLNTNTPDPRVRFANGQRRVPFTIAAGARQFSAQVVSTGTVASTATFSVDELRAGNTPLVSVPSPRQYRLPRTVPVITDACFTSTASSLTLSVTGYSTTRQITGGILSYKLANSPTEREIALNLNGSAADYYSSAEAIRNGGAFTFTLPLVIEGGEPTLGTVLLANKMGDSAARPVTRCR